jgi:DNA-binding NarL/FixJ family response regulator
MNKVRDIKLVLVDDHEVLRQGIKSLLKEHPRINVVGQAGNGKESIDLLKKIEADVVLMDLEMPVMNGDEAFVIIK